MIEVSCGEQIHLIIYARNDLAVGKIGGRDDRLRIGGIEQFDDDMRAADSLAAAFDTELLDGIGSGLNAGSVGQTDKDSAYGERIFDGVACRAADIADDSPFIAKQGIEQGGLTGIRCADNGNLHTLTDRVAGLEGVDERTDCRRSRTDYVNELAAVGKLQFLVVGEVEFEFEQGSESKELFAEFADLGGYTSPKLGESYIFLGSGVGSDEVGDGFGLGEVKSSVEERAFGELAPIGKPCAAVNEPTEQFVLNEKAAVAGNLDRILACERVRSTKNGTDDLIKRLIVTNDAAITGSAGRRGEQRVLATEKTINEGYGVCSADADESKSG